MENRFARNDGMALLLALLFIAVAIVAISTLTSRLMGQRAAVGHYQTYVDAFQGLEAALAQSKMELESGNDGAIGVDEGFAPEFDESTNEILWPEMTEDMGVTLDSMPEVKLAAFSVPWFGDGRDSNGDGIVDDNAERNLYSVFAMAQEGRTTRRLEAVYEGLDVNVWRNAIFAGAGQIGAVINGNVSIHGSVHLLGENLLTGATAITAIDLTGSSLIHNNYQGVPATLLARVPQLGQVVHDDETVYSLDAKLRVRRGLVSMSGSSEVGQPHVNGNNFKETMDGTYVNDGWTGNSVTPDGLRGDPKAVFSDNGWDEEYDLGTRVNMPLLSDDWRDPLDGGREHNASTGTWYTHEQYFSQVLLASPTNATDGARTGDITLRTNGTHIYWNATKNIYLTTLPSAAQAPAATDDYLLFNSTTDVLTMNGQIRINGNLNMQGQGSQKTIHYSGRAAILCTNATVDIDLLTCNNGNKASIANSFPVDNIIGVMATNSITVGSTSQCDIMGAFYARNRITSSKQTDVMGTFVSEYFDMGNQVPNIYQVPSLADNLPLGMIGNYPILALEQKSWREVGV